MGMQTDDDLLAFGDIPAEVLDLSENKDKAHRNRKISIPDPRSGSEAQPQL